MASRQDTVPSGARRPPFHLVFGGDEYRVNAKAREIVDALCPAADQAFGLETIEARVSNAEEASTAIRRCIEGLQTVGLLGGQKVVWLRDVSFLGENVSVSAAEGLKERVEDLTGLIKAGLPSGQALVISVQKIDKRSALFKACQASGELHEFAVPEKSHEIEASARACAVQALAEAGVSAGRDALELFLQRVGPDTRQIVQEAAKLAVYVGGRKDVRAEDVEAIVSPTREFAGWDLADAVGLRDLPRALHLLRQLVFQGESAVGLLILLESRFRDIVMLRECLDRKWLRYGDTRGYLKAEWLPSPESDAALSALPKDPRKMHPYRTARLAQQAGRYTMREALRAQRLTVAAHEAYLSGSGSTKDLGLEFLLFRLAGARPAGAGAGPAL